MPHLLKPVLQVYKRLQVSYIEYEDNAKGAPVVVFGNTPEFLTACCVPELQVNDFSIFQRNHFTREFNTYRWRNLSELSCQKLLQNVRLSRIAVARNHDFE